MTRASLPAAVSLIATLTAFAVSSSNGIASHDPASISALAPADEYFGRLKLSPLGIRHEVLTLKDDFHHARARPDVIEHKAEDVEDSIDDWATRFPQDTWIASAAWQLATLFEELPGKDAHEHAIVVLELVRDRFPDSVFADDAKRDLARGVGIRPWPHWAGPDPESVAVAPSSGASAKPQPQATSKPQSQRTAAPTAAPADPQSLVSAILVLQNSTDAAHAAAVDQLEDRFWSLSHGGTDGAYERAAWELAATFERLPGTNSKAQAIRLLALLVDRYPGDIYGRWAMRDLSRGVGERS